MHWSFPTLLVLILTPLLSAAQSPNDMMVVAQSDLVKTDNVDLLRKAQFGGEFHYFATSTITASAGFEVWTGDEFSFTIGARWYPSEETFLRLRGLIGENDIVIGGGWTKPLSNRLRFEATGDFYFKVDFAIRAGLAFTIPGK